MIQIDLFGGRDARDEGLEIKNQKDVSWHMEVFDHLHFCYGMIGTVEDFKVRMYENGLREAPDRQHSWGAWSMRASKLKRILPVAQPPRQAKQRQAHASRRVVWFVPYPKSQRTVV